MSIGKEMSIGEDIKRMRIEKNMTQQELGQKLGVSQQMIGQWETGKANPKKETIEKIAKALDVDPYSLYSFDMASEELEKELPVFNSKLNEVKHKLPAGYTYESDYSDNCFYLHYPDSYKIPCDINEIFEIINKATDYCSYELEKLRKKDE